MENGVMPEVFFNDENFTEIFEVYLTERPLISVAEAEYEVIHAPDANVSLTRKKRYKSKPFILNFRFIDKTNIKSKARQIVNWLTNKSKVSLSDDPTVYRNIQTINIEDLTNNIKELADLSIVMGTEPFWYEDVEPQRINTSATITNPSIIDAPINIDLYGTGMCNVTLNGKTIRIADVQGHVTINGVLERAYKGTTDKDNDMQGDYPILKSGQNTISISGSTEYIIVNKRWCWR